MKQYLHPPYPLSSIHLPYFWHHSLFTAILAKSLAEQIHYPKPAEAYLCGLLHDLGKLLLAGGPPSITRKSWQIIRAISSGSNRKEHVLVSPMPKQATRNELLKQ